MTDREKAIVMAYTGACMLNGDKFRIFHEYIDNIMGRPVYMHELAYKPFADEIKEKAKADFIALCAEQEPILDKIRAEIKDWQVDIHDNEYDADKHDFVFERIFEIIDKYKESEG